MSSTETMNTPTPEQVRAALASVKHHLGLDSCRETREPYPGVEHSFTTLESALAQPASEASPPPVEDADVEDALATLDPTTEATLRAALAAKEPPAIIKNCHFVRCGGEVLDGKTPVFVSILDKDNFSARGLRFEAAEAHLAAAENRGFRKAAEWLERRFDVGLSPSPLDYCYDLRAEADRREGK